METFSSGLLPVELMVEHHELDSQHDEIFGCIEQLKESLLEVDALTPEKLQRLVDHFDHHFATEARLAKEAMIDFSRHGEEHGRNLRLLHKACDELRAGKLELRAFLRYLEYWFEHHINEYDKPLGQRLADRSATLGGRSGRLNGGIGLSA